MQITAAGAEVRGRDGMGTDSYSCQEKSLQKSRGTMGFQAFGDFLGEDRVAQERSQFSPTKDPIWQHGTNTTA